MITYKLVEHTKILLRLVIFFLRASSAHVPQVSLQLLDRLNILSLKAVKHLRWEAAVLAFAWF